MDGLTDPAHQTPWPSIKYPTPHTWSLTLARASSSSSELGFLWIATFLISSHLINRNHGEYAFSSSLYVSLCLFLINGVLFFRRMWKLMWRWLGSPQRRGRSRSSATEASTWMLFSKFPPTTSSSSSLPDLAEGTLHAGESCHWT